MNDKQLRWSVRIAISKRIHSHIIVLEIRCGYKKNPEVLRSSAKRPYLSLVHLLPEIHNIEAFDKVQAERERRNSVSKGSDGTIKKSARFSSLKGITAHELEECEKLPNKEEY